MEPRINNAIGGCILGVLISGIACIIYVLDNAGDTGNQNAKDTSTNSIVKRGSKEQSCNSTQNRYNCSKLVHIRPTLNILILLLVTLLVTQRT